MYLDHKFILWHIGALDYFELHPDYIHAYSYFVWVKTVPVQVNWSVSCKVVFGLKTNISNVSQNDIKQNVMMDE